MDYIELLNLDIIFEISKKIVMYGDFDDLITLSELYKSFQEVFARSDLYYPLIEDVHVLKLFKHEANLRKLIPWYSKYRIYVAVINLQKFYMIPIILLKSRLTHGNFGIIFEGVIGIINLDYLDLPGINFPEVESVYITWMKYRTRNYTLEINIQEISDNGTYNVHWSPFFGDETAIKSYNYPITEDTLKDLIIRLLYAGVRLYDIQHLDIIKLVNL